MTLDDRSGGNSIAVGLAVLVIRGTLLWIVVPVAALAWPLIGRRYRRQGVTLGQYLGWVDVNLIAFLQRIVLRPFVRNPAPWVPRTKMSEVSHRIRANDPV